MRTATPSRIRAPEPELPITAPGNLQGVDGCRGGWLVITAPALPCSLEALRWELHADLGPALADPAVGLTAIDMPIGLASCGPRPCDRQARALLGARRSSVFPAPLRAVLVARTYAEACDLSEAASGRRLSRQAYNLLPKIRQLDTLFQAEPGLRQQVWEVHPELAFRQMNDGVPMAAAKKRREGASQRQNLLERRLPGAVAAIRATTRRQQVADDDILDALACLWSADRLRRGQALMLGGETDATGLAMRIAA